MKTAIYGAGGFGREVKMLLDQISRVYKDRTFAGYIDDNTQFHPVADLSEVEDILISIADPIIRKQIAGKLINQYQFKNLIHTDIFIDPSNKIEKGCIICSGVKITVGVVVKDFCIINLNSVVGHDVVMGPFCSIMPSANILGGVTLGEGVFIGSNSTILQGVTIGNHAIVGAGSVVTHSVSAGQKVAGVPARLIGS
jgi:sugar O-acyltransferase (sialic acid O-acetyltransferase NeuD family)